MKEPYAKVFRLLIIVFLPLLFISCDSIGFLSEKNRFLPHQIETFGDFVVVYFILQLSILFVTLVLGIFLGKGGSLISLVIHFIWIVSFRDYGFFKVLLLFGIFTFVKFVISSTGIFSRRQY